MPNVHQQLLILQVPGISHFFKIDKKKFKKCTRYPKYTVGKGWSSWHNGFYNKWNLIKILKSQQRCPLKQMPQLVSSLKKKPESRVLRLHHRLDIFCIQKLKFVALCCYSVGYYLISNTFQNVAPLSRHCCLKMLLFVRITCIT